MVLIQCPEYGGGEIYFDDVLIRKDGLFILPELETLKALIDKTDKVRLVSPGTDLAFS